MPEIKDLTLRQLRRIAEEKRLLTPANATQRKSELIALLEESERGTGRKEASHV